MLRYEKNTFLKSDSITQILVSTRPYQDRLKSDSSLSWITLGFEHIFIHLNFELRLTNFFYHSWIDPEPDGCVGETKMVKTLSLTYWSWIDPKNKALELIPNLNDVLKTQRCSTHFLWPIDLELIQRVKLLNWSQHRSITICQIHTDLGLCCKTI